MTWGQINATTYPHKWIFNIGNYGGKPIVTSSESPNNLKTEIYDHDSHQWVESTDYAWHT